ncbi:inorganic phosphate transporter [Rothia nasimurium]|uniref:inorganic phosphate transporter n=1 Tax=Rothia nasimurium TaxID=85336 RepID=UPI001F38E43E|nr:inorganic phosphate transporter [Rothia nasimurium]
MTTELIILVIVVLTALAFDFTNGFHDTANAMASSIATGALKPKAAVALSAILNLIGAFLSIEVAKTVGSGLIDLETAGGGPNLMLIVFTGLVGAILWNVFTWLLGLPSSSSHALFGGLIGATLASLGTDGVLWNGVLMKIIVPALMAPLIAGMVACIGTATIYALTNKVSEKNKTKNFRFGQISAASLMSLAHGTNDAQKTMGVIFLALVAANEIDPEADIPFWVRFVCAVAIALGTYLGGWRIIKTMGKGIVDIDGPQGFAADGSSAAIILTSSHFGMALSTTHVATGSIIGSGVGRRAKVSWSTARRMVIAWIITLPAAGSVGAITWFVGNGINSVTGSAWMGEATVFLILVGFCFWMWAHSRKNAVTHLDMHSGEVRKLREVHTESLPIVEKAGS